MNFNSSKLSVLIAVLVMFASPASFAQSSETQACICKGKLTTLTLRYLGGTTTSVWVIQKDGDVIYENTDLTMGKVFSFTGTYRQGSNTTLGPYIDVYMGDGSIMNIHTSCSVEINVGDVIGIFRVIAGTSRVNGALCNNPEPPECDPDVEECPDDPDSDG